MNHTIGRSESNLVNPSPGCEEPAPFFQEIDKKLNQVLMGLAEKSDYIESKLGKITPIESTPTPKDSKPSDQPPCVIGSLYNLAEQFERIDARLSNCCSLLNRLV